MRWLMTAILASLLAPALADCLHSSLVVLRGIRFYQAELGDLANPYYWSFGAWLCCVVGWLWLARQMEVVFK